MQRFDHRDWRADIGTGGSLNVRHTQDRGQEKVGEWGIGATSLASRTTHCGALYSASLNLNIPQLRAWKAVDINENCTHKSVSSSVSLGPGLTGP